MLPYTVFYLMALLKQENYRSFIPSVFGLLISRKCLALETLNQLLVLISETRLATLEIKLQRQIKLPSL